MEEFGSSMRLTACLFASALLLCAIVGGDADATSSRLDDYLASGRKLMQRGDFAAAVVEFKNAVQSDPDSGDAHYGLALALVGADNLQPAEAEFRAAATKGYNSGEVEAGLAELFLKQERDGQVLDEFEDGDRPAAIEARIRQARGWAYYYLKRTKSAEREFADAMKLASNPAQAEMGLAETRLVQDDFKGGAELLEKSVVDDPHLVQAWVLLGRVRDILGDRVAARQALNQALTVAPDDASAHLSRAELVVDDDDTQAATDIAFVLERFPNNIRANLLDAIMKARHQDWAAAETALMQIPRQEEVPKALYLLARVNLAQGQYEQAERNITHFLALVPNEPDAIGVQVTLLVQQGKLRQAIDVLNKALVAHPDDMSLLGLLSDTYTSNGQPEQAAAALKRISTLAPRDEATRLGLAMRYMKVGLPDHALDELTIARASAPLSAPAASLAIEAMFSAGRIDEAASAAEALARTAPNDPAGETMRGIVALRKEGVAAARTHFERALALDPGFATAAIDLAQTYRLERHFDEARAIYDRALQRNATNLPLLMARADLEVAAGKPDDAVSWLERARVADPRAELPRLRLVVAYLARNDGAHALAVAQELEQIAPANPQAVSALADAELANDDRPSAIASFKRVAQMTRRAPDAVLRLADVLALDNKVAEASDYMRQLIETNPGDPHLQQALIAFARRTNTLADFIDFARSLGPRNPGDPAIDELTGQLLEADKKYDEAVKAYSAGLAKGKSGHLTLVLAEAQMRADNLAAALATLTGWLQTQPGDRPARFLLASLLESSKDDSGAIKQYERLVADKGDDAIALNELAGLYQSIGDARAEATAERAYAAAPQSPVIADTLGWILVERGATERGMALLHQAADVPAASPTTRYHLAVALDKSGRREEAKHLLGELLQSTAPFAERPAAEKLRAQLGG